MAGLDLEVLMNQVQEVQLLAFIFVKTFGLDGEETVRIYRDVLRVLQPVCKGGFVVAFDGG